MSFTVAPAFKEALKSTIALSKAVRIERKDGEVFAFTDAGYDLILPAKTWGNITIPATLYIDGISRFPRDLQQSRDPRKLDNWEFVAFTDTDPGTVTEIDILRGAWVGARYSLILFARSNLTWQILRQRGRLGQGTLDKGSVTWKMKGLSGLLDQEVLDVTSPLSRAVWGDPELAHFDLDGNTQDGFPARVQSAVTTADANWPRRRFRLAQAQGFPAYRFSDGTITFFNGPNTGIVASVLDYETATGEFTLDADVPAPIAAGDLVRAQIRPPLTLEDWILFFGDGKYFAGEPGIPNTDSANEIQFD